MQAYLKTNDILKATGWSRSFLHKLRRMKAFPEPIVENGVRLGWLESQLKDWQEQQKSRAAEGVAQ